MRDWTRDSSPCLLLPESAACHCHCPCVDPGMFDGLYNALATRLDTDELKEWTLLLTMNDRQIRLRPETKTAFDQWSQLLNARIPKLRVQPMFEGWVWRRFGSYAWRQRFAILHDGIYAFFVFSFICIKICASISTWQYFHLPRIE